MIRLAGSFVFQLERLARSVLSSLLRWCSNLLRPRRIIAGIGREMGRIFRFSFSLSLSLCSNSGRNTDGRNAITNRAMTADVG